MCVYMCVVVYRAHVIVNAWLSTVRTGNRPKADSIGGCKRELGVVKGKQTNEVSLFTFTIPHQGDDDGHISFADQEMEPHPAAVCC